MHRSGRTAVSGLVVAALMALGAGEAAAQQDFQTLADECRANGGEERLCRSLAQLGRDAAQACRFAGGPLEACAVFDRRLIAEDRMAAYESGWAHRALGLQSRLDERRPLRLAFIPATHNSFNSAAYAPTLSGLDHNQVYSLGDQLRMDMRGLELDVHWIPSASGDAGFAPVLCHGQDVAAGPVTLHVGCTIERHLREGLKEIHDWLVANPTGELLLLYLENHLDGDPAAHDAAATAIETELGELVYRPDANTPCAAMPANQSRMDLLGPGDASRVLIVGNCDPTFAAWGSWVHEREQANTWIESSSPPGTDYPDYPACDAPGAERHNATGEAGAEYDQRFVRWYEDSTWLTAMVNGEPREITLEETGRMARCGVNLIGFDQLTPEDARLEAMVWSWAKDQPSTTVAPGSCAHLGSDGRFYQAGCETNFLQYACRSGEPPGTWTVVGPGGPWSGGTDACGVPAKFAVPATAYENELLKAAGGTNGVWLNYAVGANGWTPNLQ